MTTTRDALISDLQDAVPVSDDRAAVAADWLLDQGWRRCRKVLTAEELDALPFGSVVVDYAGVARTKRRRDSIMPGGWTSAGRTPISSKELADGHNMVVVWVPGEDR